MQKKRIMTTLPLMAIALTLVTGAIGYASLSEPAPWYNAESSDLNALVLSSQNPSVGGIVKTNKGNDIWVKGDESSGVNWNNGSGNISIAKNGYLQTLTIIHGISKVKVEMVSGSLDLYHGYVEPADLETPMYGADATFTANGEFVFTDKLPNRVRFRATNDSIVKRITICYDCETTDEDANAETLEDGLENSYIDAGPIGRYATTSYVSGSGNVSSESSKRSLRLEFSKTTNNYVSFNTAQNTKKGLADADPDFTDKALTLKAKFSGDIDDKTISASAVGSTWKDSTFVPMERKNLGDGWYSYRLDFSKLNFVKNDDIIRINVRPDGVNSSNKDTAWVLLDEVNIAPINYGADCKVEDVYKGLENMDLDYGMTNVNYSFDIDTKYGDVSTSSMVLTPGTSMGSASHWFVTFSPQVQQNFQNYIVKDFSKGLLSFDYKPICTASPTLMYLEVFQDWGTSVKKTLNGSPTKDGWYRVSYNLANLGLTSQSIIRFRIGFDVEADKKSQCKVYLDNLKVKENAQEDYTLGLENMPIDAGMSVGCYQSVDYAITAGESSMNSMKTVISGNSSTQAWQNSYGMILQPTNEQASRIKMNQGKLEAKFRFQGDFPTKKLWLCLFDQAWNGGRFKDVETYPLGDGWYQASIDFSSLQTWSGNKAVASNFSFSDSPVRMGFGYQDVTSANNQNKTVWIDDVFYYPTNTPSSFSMWQAYSTENVKRDDAIISGREISAAKPLEWSDVRNGTDSTQLMVKASSAISSYQFRPGTLRSENGGVLNASAFDVSIAKYFNCVDTNEAGKTGYPGAGWYPDALIPQGKLLAAGEDQVALGHQQSIYINCTIPEDQLPGVYTGSGILNVDGTDYTVPMKVNVYNAKLSGTMHGKTSFLNWYDMVERGEGSENYNETMRNAYYDFMLTKNVSPDHNYGWDKWSLEGMDDYDSFAEKFARYIMPNKKITTYRIPANTSKASLLGYLRALVNRNIVEWDSGNHVNFFDKAVFILIDEPSTPKLTNLEPQAWKDAKALQANLAACKSELASLVTSYPVIREGLNNVRNIMTIGCEYKTITGSGYYKDLLNSTYVDTPCPQFQLIDNATERAKYLSFNHTWFYGCVSPKLPYPSFHTDTPLIGQRVIPWMQYKYGIEGQLYFCNNFFVYEKSGEWLDRDVWNEPKTSSSVAGDGMLVYPGKKYNIFGPITTMRLENIRNSYEDYEYFYLMDQNIETYKANTGRNINSCKDLILSEMDKMFTGTTLLTRGHADTTGYKSPSFHAFRTYLLEQLEYCY